MREPSAETLQGTVGRRDLVGLSRLFAFRGLSNTGSGGPGPRENRGSKSDAEAATPKIEFAAAPGNAVQVSFTETGDTRFIEDSKGKPVVMNIGIGKSEAGAMDQHAALILARRVVREAHEHNGGHELDSIAISFSDFRRLASADISDYDLGMLMGENLLLANYEFRTYKTSASPASKQLTRIVVMGASAEAQKGFHDGQIIGEETNWARDLENTPGSDKTPPVLAERMRQHFEGTKVSIRVLDEVEIHRLGMGLLEGVARGSEKPPRFVVAEYWGAGQGSENPTVLVGKGVTFDTGGLDIKAKGGMTNMEMDMSGGADVLAAIASAARLGVKRNVVALVPLAENGVGPNAVYAGEVLPSMSGKTVQVTNTDAEGRLILADAITYAQTFYEPAEILEVSTLTGAAQITVGNKGSLVMTKDKALEARVMGASRASGTRVAPLPLEWDYSEHLAGEKADLQNYSYAAGGLGSSLIAGAFLDSFAEVPYAHFDIAPRDNAAPGDHLAHGATGEPTSMLVRYLMQKK